jgi:hypothetical protein
MGRQHLCQRAFYIGLFGSGRQPTNSPAWLAQPAFFRKILGCPGPGSRFSEAAESDW